MLKQRLSHISPSNHGFSIDTKYLAVKSKLFLGDRAGSQRLPGSGGYCYVFQICALPLWR